MFWSNYIFVWKDQHINIIYSETFHSTYPDAQAPRVVKRNNIILLYIRLYGQICLDVLPRTDQTNPRHARDFSNQSLFDPSQPFSRPTKHFSSNGAHKLAYICVCVPKKRINLAKRRLSCIIHFFPPSSRRSTAAATPLHAHRRGSQRTRLRFSNEPPPPAAALVRVAGFK